MCYSGSRPNLLAAGPDRAIQALDLDLLAIPAAQYIPFYQHTRKQIRIYAEQRLHDNIHLLSTQIRRIMLELHNVRTATKSSGLIVYSDLTYRLQYVQTNKICLTSKFRNTSQFAIISRTIGLRGSQPKTKITKLLL